MRNSNSAPAFSASLGTSMIGGRTEEAAINAKIVICAGYLGPTLINVIPNTDVYDGMVSPNKTSMELHCNLLARLSSLFCLRCSPVANDSQKRTKSRSMWNPYGQH